MSRLIALFACKIHGKFDSACNETWILICRLVITILGEGAKSEGLGTVPGGTVPSAVGSKGEAPAGGLG